MRSIFSSLPQSALGGARLSPVLWSRRIIYDKIDVDKDGQLTEEELAKWMKHAQTKYITEDADKQWSVSSMSIVRRGTETCFVAFWLCLLSDFY